MWFVSYALPSPHGFVHILVELLVYREPGWGQTARQNGYGAYNQTWAQEFCSEERNHCHDKPRYVSHCRYLTLVSWTLNNVWDLPVGETSHPC